MKYPLICQLLICNFIFFTIILNAQETLQTKIDAIENLESEEKKIEQLHLLLESIDTSIYSEDQISIYNALGNAYFNIEEDNLAIDFLRKGIELVKKIRPSDTQMLNERRYELSQVYKAIGRSDDQNQLLHLIIQEGRKDAITTNSHADIGRNIALKGDYHGGLQYLNTVLADSELMNDIDNELIIRIKIVFIYASKYETIFEAEKDNPDLKILKQHQYEIERKFAKSNIPKYKYYNIQNNLGVVYGAYEDGLITALDSYNKSLNYYRKVNNKYYELEALTNIGTVYSKQNLHKKAEACYQEVIDNSEDKEQIATAYVNMGFFLDRDSSKMKIPYFLKAFDVILEQNSKQNSSFELPSIEVVLESEYYLEILDYLIDFANVLVQSHKESNNVYYLKKAKKTVYLIDQIVSFIRLESASEQSKLFWIAHGVDSYMLGVEICYLLNQTDEAFYFMEKNKALLLQENIKTLREKWELDLPIDLLDRENGLSHNRYKLYQKLLLDPDNLNTKKAYTDINSEFLSFRDSLESQYPKYYKTKTQLQITELDEAVSKYVSKGSSFIEFILNEKDGYGIFCSSNEKSLFKIHNVDVLQDELKKIEMFWISQILDKTNTAEFQKLSNSIFSKLFPSPQMVDKLSGKQLTIISDQSLHHVPFEALSVKDDIDLVDSYLINFCEISYLQSISVSEQIRQKENNPKNMLLGLAPFQFDYAGLQDLSYSNQAIDELSNFQSSKILEKVDATKKNFLYELNNYNIIHLNTHAGIDSFNLEPWIAFRNKKMDLSELYGKENQAELVVLDACKTNDGKLALGEGIFNLSRGFFFNGTQSVLASMWNVNEQSGNTIINTFYNQLANGKTKSKALQLAKIDYLKKHQYSEVLPYYWAAYTLTGSTTPIKLKRNNNLLNYLGLGALVLVLLFFFRTKFLAFKQ